MSKGSPVISSLTTKSVLLRMSFGSVPAASGTGFIATTGYQNKVSSDDLYLVTARHNFTGRHHDSQECLSDTGIVPDRVTIFHHSSSGLGNWVEVEQPLIDENGDSLWIEHFRGGGRYDIAALKLMVSPNMLLSDPEWRVRKTLHYQIRRRYFDMAAYPGSPASVIGFPFGTGSSGAFPIWLTGHIASEVDLNFGGNPCFLIDCRTRPGSSGSPVALYSKGSFQDSEGYRVTVDNGADAERPLGLYSARIRPDSDIGIVWDWQTICELLDPTLSPTYGHILG